jgi:hypothetical protein
MSQKQKTPKRRSPDRASPPVWTLPLIDQKGKNWLRVARRDPTLNILEGRVLVGMVLSRYNFDRNVSQIITRASKLKFPKGCAKGCIHLTGSYVMASATHKAVEAYEDVKVLEFDLRAL